MITEKYYSCGYSYYRSLRNLDIDEIYQHMYGAEENQKRNKNGTLCKGDNSYLISNGIHMFKSTMDLNETFIANKNFIHWNHINHPSFIVSDHVSFVYSGALKKDIVATLSSGETKTASYTLDGWTELTFRAHEFYTEDIVDFTTTYTALEQDTSFYCIFRRDNLNFHIPPERDLGPIYRKRYISEQDEEINVPQGYIAFVNVLGILEHEFLYAPTEDKKFLNEKGNEVLFVKIDDGVEDI